MCLSFLGYGKHTVISIEIYQLYEGIEIILKSKGLIITTYISVGKADPETQETKSQEC